MTVLNLQQFQQLMDENLLSPKLDASSDELMALFETKQCHNESRAEANLRLAIYRNNVIHSLSSAMGDLYPVVKKLIGEDCFNGAAIEFVRSQPPQHAALLHYGREFCDFIGDFEPCKTLIFLPDIAMLEFEYNQAYHSGDAEPFSPHLLGAVSPDELGYVSFKSHPSLRLMQSCWPIDDIWHENQNEQPGVINLDDSSGVSLLIYRLGLSVQLVSLDENCFVFLEQLVQCKTINQAWSYTVALANQKQRDLGDDELSGMLGYLFSLDIFTTFDVNV